MGGSVVSIERPVIVLGGPRSGTTLLFSMLSSHPDVWSLYRESEPLFERHFHPARQGWDRGNRLDVTDATPEVVADLRDEFERRSTNRQIVAGGVASQIYRGGRIERLLWRSGPLWSPVRPSAVRLVEKTPKNCLRVPFLRELFPDASFVVLTRDPRPCIASLIEGWNDPTGRYRTYDLPVPLSIGGYTGTSWNFLLPPGWERHVASTLAEVAAFQYCASYGTALDDLVGVPADRVHTVAYEELVADPVGVLGSICAAVGLEPKGGALRIAETMPAINARSAPSADKWRRHEDDVLRVMPTVRAVAERLGYDV